MAAESFLPARGAVAQLGERLKGIRLPASDTSRHPHLTTDNYDCDDQVARREAGIESALSRGRIFW